MLSLPCSFTSLALLSSRVQGLGGTPCLERLPSPLTLHLSHETDLTSGATSQRPPCPPQHPLTLDDTPHLSPST